MRRIFALSILVGLTMMGCNQGSDVSESDFMLAGGGRGWNAVTPIEWTARNYMVKQPPMDGVLVNALADPFAADSSWLAPAAKDERTAIASTLEGWWTETQGPDGGSMEDAAVASQFSVVVAARVLQARVASVDGHAAEGFEVAVDTLKMAKSAMDTAPEGIASDMIPSVLIASEAVSNLSQAPEIDAKALELGLAALNIDIPGSVAVKLSRVYFKQDLPELQKLLKDSNYAKNMAETLNQLNTNEGLEKSLSGMVGSAKKPDQLKTAELAYETVMKVLDGSTFEQHSQAVKGQQESMIQNWGEDVFNNDPDKWDMTKVASSVKASANPIGVFFIQDIVRKYNSVVESSFLAQMEIDAHRIRVASEIVKRKTGAYPKSAEEIDGVFGRRGLRDRLTGEKYIIDFEKWTLKTPLKEAGPEFIFVNQIIMSGSKI